MKMKFLLFVLALIAVSQLGFASVSTYEINYDLGTDRVSENIHIIFSEKTNSTLELSFVNRIAVTSVSDENGLIESRIIQGRNYTLLVYPKTSNEILIKLVQFDSVLSSQDFYQFIDDFSSGETIGKLVVSASLPKGYVIYNNFFLPQNADIITDGERITVLWIENDLNAPSMIYSLKFTGTSDYVFAIIPVIVIFVIVAFFLLFYKNQKKKLLHEFKKGFSDDEIKVVDIMKKERTMYQNKIEKELHFSRAKMTRITEKLRKKNLIEKKRYGRTNRLKWTG